jgi:hypothetical protein
MDHILIKSLFWHHCEMSLHHLNERLVRGADGDTATFGISISPGRFAALSLKAKEQRMKAITITLAAVLALSSCLSAAQGAHHGKKSRHSAARSMKAPTSAGMPSRECRTIPNMSSNNWFGVDNDVNVYRDKPQCN